MSFSGSIEAEEEVEVVFENIEEEEESVEDPEAEWSSVLCFTIGPQLTKKQKLFEEGLYTPPEKEVCTKYVTMSTSSILRHPYYKYPAVLDPGIEEAFNEVNEVYQYPDDGMEKYLDLCEEMGECPVRLFYHSLLNDTINLKYYGVSPYGFRPMGLALKKNTYVKKIDFTDNFISFDGCFHLGDMLAANRTIVEVNLDGCRMGPEGCRLLLDKLCFNTSLKKLNLARNRLGDKGMYYVAVLISNGTCIEDFNFSQNNLTSITANYLAEAFECNNALKRLDLSWNSLQVPRSVENMCKFLQVNTSLLEVNLSWNGLNYRHSKIIEYILGAPNLEALYLSNNRLTGSVIPDIVTSLATAKKLKTLDLSFNPLTPDEARSLLMRMRRKTSHLNNLLLDGVPVTQVFVNLKNRILNLAYRKDAIVIHGYVKPTIKVKEKDLREIIFNRADFLCKKPKKKPVDIAVVILQLQKLVNNQPIVVEEDLPRLIQQLGAVQLSKDLIKQMGFLFLASPQKKVKKKFCDVEAMAEYVKMKWPDAKLPPPTPPPTPPPPPPPPAPKNKGKGKDKKKKK